MRSKITIEIGSFYTKIYKEKQDIVLYEPTLIIIKNHNYKNPIAYGLSAESMLDKLSADYEAIRPIGYSSIVDQDALVALLGYFIKKIKEPYELNPNVILSIQLGSDRHLMKEYLDVFDRLNIYNVEFVETPVLSLIGAGANITETNSAMLIDLGYSQTTVCALTLDGVINGASIDLGGKTLNNNIKSYIEQTKTITFADYDIEKMKIKLSGLIENDNTQSKYQGRQTYSGQLRCVTISCNDIYKPVHQYIEKVVDFIKIIIKNLPSGAINDFKVNGIYLTGGGSHIYGLKDHLESELGYTINYSYQGELSSIFGGGYLLNNKKLLNKIKLKNN